jgi:hypothetical protein
VPSTATVVVPADPGPSTYVVHRDAD